MFCSDLQTRPRRWNVGPTTPCASATRIYAKDTLIIGSSICTPLIRSVCVAEDKDLRGTLRDANLYLAREPLVGDASISDLCHRHGCPLPVHIFRKSIVEIAAMVNGGVPIAHSVAITGRVWKSALVRGQPPYKRLRTWVDSELPDENPNAHNDDESADIDLHMPASFQADTGPRKWRRAQSADTLNGEDIVRQLSFARHLRDTAHTQMALDDALEVYFPDDEKRNDVKNESNTHVACASKLAKSRLRMDAVGMNLDRREIAQLVKFPERVVSGHVFSDGSPVTGTEIQGSILQLCLTDGRVLEFILPGMSMMYGFCRCIDKAICFMWSLWLVAGPSRHTFEFVLKAQRANV